jgi:hypothetical protein
MTCRDAQNLLNDFVDNLLPEMEAQRMQDHLASCADCRESAMRLRQLIRTANGLPREAEHSERLWQAVRRRIEAQEAATPARHPRPVRLVLALCLAGIVLAVSAASFGYWLNRRQGAPADLRAGGEPRSMERALAEYVRARDALLAELNENMRDLPPQTLAAVRDNLVIADEAISQVRVALQQQPDNQHLHEMLYFAYERELAFLAQVVSVSRNV